MARIAPNVHGLGGKGKQKLERGIGGI